MPQIKEVKYQHVHHVYYGSAVVSSATALLRLEIKDKLSVATLTAKLDIVHKFT